MTHTEAISIISESNLFALLTESEQKELFTYILKVIPSSQEPA